MKLSPWMDMYITGNWRGRLDGRIARLEGRYDYPLLPDSEGKTEMTYAYELGYSVGYYEELYDQCA